MQHPEEYPDFFDEHSLFGFTLDDSKAALNLETVEGGELIACTE